MHGLAMPVDIYHSFDMSGFWRAYRLFFFLCGHLGSPSGENGVLIGFSPLKEKSCTLKILGLFLVY